MAGICLDQLREGYEGKPFRELIDYHLQRQKQGERIKGVLGTVELLPPEAQPLVEEFIDAWNVRAYDASFWITDTASVLEEITADARRRLNNVGASTDDETLFNMFNIVVMNFAYGAHTQPKMRQFIWSEQIGFPWLSAIALLYPLAAALYISMTTAAPTPMIVGYGIANLGYLLVAAGIVSGTFKVFCLRRRAHVFLAAGLAIAVGIGLTNFGLSQEKGTQQASGLPGSESPSIAESTGRIESVFNLSEAAAVLNVCFESSAYKSLSTERGLELHDLSMRLSTLAERISIHYEDEGLLLSYDMGSTRLASDPELIRYVMEEYNYCGAKLFKEIDQYVVEQEKIIGAFLPIPGS